MIISMLFNWRHYSQDANYWDAIREVVFTTGIIQRSGRHMKLSIGDVLVGIKRGQDPEALYIAAFDNSKFRLVDEARLAHGFPTVFGMMFENMSPELAFELHEALLPHQGYLGALSVHFEFGPHLALYRSRLPLMYRLQGTRLRSFYSMGEQDGCDEYDLEEMRRLGYTDVGFEDAGASRTILDDFDTPRHFKRVATFRELLLSSSNIGEDEAYELTMLLEDLSPKLFNALGAAAERLAEAENEEEVAQSAISGRRYMEQLADALFPPTDTPRGQRKLGKQAYKNRLWAFLEEHTHDKPDRLKEIGGEIDRIVEELNAGLHSDRPKERIAHSICDAALLTATLLTLDPAGVRNGYLAYADSIRTFMRELISHREGGKT